MPRIKIIALPKAKDGFQIGGGSDNCDDGYVWDDLIQQCVPDPNASSPENSSVFQPHWQTMGSGTATTVPGSTYSNSNKGPWLDRNLQKLANTKAFKFADKWGHNIEKGAYIAQPFIDYINDRKAQKRWDKWFRESALPDNMYAAKSASATGNRGDWDINTGIFRPNEIGFKSKGMYTNYFQYPGNTVAYGGTPINNNNMQKIRIQITSVPQPKMFMGGNPYSPNNLNSQNFGWQNYGMENLESFKPQDPIEHLQQNIGTMRNNLGLTQYPRRSGKYFMATGGQPMTYSGQLGYGINLGQKRIYTDMPAPRSEELSKTLKPVPRDKANIEAEKNETAWGDLDGDGALEHMEIGGNRHVDGGTPLNVPEGTFIFSDTKNMTIKDENILKMFNMPANKKGYTPAEIAKKYDINKYKAIIEDPSVDEMRKGTAQLMVKTYQKKLAQLALIQEQMKGFPQGIPDVAKKVMPELAQIQNQGQQSQIPQQEDNQQIELPKQQMGEGEQLPANGMAYGGNYYAKEGMVVTTETTKKPYKQAFDKGRAFLTNWMNSPMYRKMYSQSTKEPFLLSGSTYDKNSYDALRRNELANVYFNVEGIDPENPGTAAYSQTYEPWHIPMTGIPTTRYVDKKGKVFYYEPKIAFIDRGPNTADDIYSNATHEVSHATDRGGELIPDVDSDLMTKYASSNYLNSPIFNRDVKNSSRRDILSNKKFTKDRQEWLDYVNDPTETRARLNDFRMRAKEQGLYDPFTQPFNIQYLKNYQPIPEKNDTYFDPLKQLRDSYTDEEITDMLNKISRTQSNVGYDKAAYGGTSRLGMYVEGGLADPTTTTTVPPSGIYNQTVSPTQLAKLDDPEYKELVNLLKEVAVYSGGKYHLRTISNGKQKRLSELITKYGLSHPDEGSLKGHEIVQHGTTDYSWYDRGLKKNIGFFGGLNPEMYEDKFIEAVYDPARVAKMTRLEKRKLFLKELGVDLSKHSDAELSNTKALYTNPNFFKNEFYPGFTNTFLSSEYRTQRGNDLKLGLEHYDSFQWKAPTTIIPPPASSGKFVCVEGVGVQSYDATKHAGLSVYDKYEDAQQACYVGPDELKQPNIRKMPFKYMTPDLVNMAAAASVPPKKYLPWAPQLPFEPGDVVFEDWRAKAAERQSLMNKMMNQMNTYAPGTSAASNLSFLAGQGSEGLIKDIADVDARNVATANAFSQQEMARKDKNMAANLGRAEDLYKGNVIANQQYDNAKRQYINNLAKTFGQAWKNRMYLGLLNNVNTMYPVDPVTGQSIFLGGKGSDKLGGNSSGGASGYKATDYQSLVDYYTNVAKYPADKASEQAILDIRGGKNANKDLNDGRDMLQYYLPNVWGN